ncbi:MAG TPA: fructose-6-phosphate aldolase [Candidatus Omnitrophica bacterium]|nr:MAG: fructose-6-phosphate aldolase [Candidatus Omnitrophota bacterium]RKY35409.1 MAG: fructose-6-phosphate aldolase [Candidatus Omnitrophota bacterium]HEC68734.1 fructose-6-phosphate aldolase [Candidatus Omnitrophota bacterium]
MKIFIDSANLEEIKQASSLGLLDGVTTNPTLLSREGKDPIAQLKEICSIVEGPVSAEVVAQDSEGMVKEARQLAKLADNIVIKIPVTNEGLRATKILSQEGIKTNLTLCFSPLQALLSAKAGANFISPFVGRLDDISTEGMSLVSDIKLIYDNYNIKTEIIVASVRHPIHVLEAARLGAHIATCPFKVILQFLKHPLTDIGIERFLSDWKKLKDTLGR